MNSHEIRPILEHIRDAQTRLYTLRNNDNRQWIDELAAKLQDADNSLLQEYWKHCQDNNSEE